MRDPQQKGNGLTRLEKGSRAIEGGRSCCTEREGLGLGWRRQALLSLLARLA
jgi:hypothetical protein